MGDIQCTDRVTIASVIDTVYHVGRKLISKLTQRMRTIRASSKDNLYGILPQILFEIRLHVKSHVVEKCRI